MDNFIEGPKGEFDWCFTDQDYGMAEFFQRVDCVFIGRKSYELMQTMDEAEIPGMPKMKHYVFTNSLQQVNEGDEIIRGSFKSQVQAIKNGPGKDIWLFGGAVLTASLMNEGLVDELWLSVHPILLGQGKPLFTGIQGRTKLVLTETKTYETGLVSLKYTFDNQ